MDVVIAGGHGQIALRLSTLLTGQGHTVRSIVRNPDHTDDVAATGASPVVADLEKISATDLAGHLTGADAVVFAAGAGPGSGVERKETVDRDGAVLLADAAATAGIRRYVLISSTGVDAEPDPSAARSGPLTSARRRPPRRRSAPTAGSTRRSCARGGSRTTRAPAGSCWPRRRWSTAT